MIDPKFIDFTVLIFNDFNISEDLQISVNIKFSNVAFEVSLEYWSSYNKYAIVDVSYLFFLTYIILNINSELFEFVIAVLNETNMSYELNDSHLDSKLVIEPTIPNFDFEVPLLDILLSSITFIIKGS